MKLTGVLTESKINQIPVSFSQLFHPLKNKVELFYDQQNGQ